MRDCPLISTCMLWRAQHTDIGTHTQIHEGGEQPALDWCVTDLGSSLDLLWLNTDKSGGRVKYLETRSFAKGSETQMALSGVTTQPNYLHK